MIHLVASIKCQEIQIDTLFERNFSCAWHDGVRSLRRRWGQEEALSIFFLFCRTSWLQACWERLIETWWDYGHLKILGSGRNGDEMSFYCLIFATGHTFRVDFNTFFPAVPTYHLPNQFTSQQLANQKIVLFCADATRRSSSRSCHAKLQLLYVPPKL